MKKIILLLSLIIFYLFAYTQAPRIVIRDNISEYKTRPAFLPCRSNTVEINYLEKNRAPIIPFNFQKLHFETQFDYYLKVTIDIDASGKTIVIIQDDYYNQNTTIRSTMNRDDFSHLMIILARCDFDSFQEESVEEDVLNGCISTFEILFNNIVKRAKKCAFFPFENRELEIFLRNRMNICENGTLITPRIEY